MDRELVEFYKKELSILYDYAGAFAEEYPGIADRLGGLARERGDPMVAGLLEGAALLAARVQLKLKHEFSEFTFNLLDQLLPNYVAPTPSFMMAQIRPVYGDPALRSGRTIPKGALIDVAYPFKDRSISCTFTLSTPITYGPFDLPRAEYMPSVAPLQALGLNAGKDVAAGLRLTLRLRLAASEEEEPADTVVSDDPATRIAGCALDVLPLHFIGPEADAVALYEQMFSRLNGVWIRHLDSFGDPKFRQLPVSMVEQIGFDADEHLLPYEARRFRGFDLLQEYMVFPRKFLGCRIRGLRAALADVQARNVDIIFTFDQANPRLAAAVNPEMFALHAAPAVNLFRKTADRVTVRANQHEYLIVPDRTQYIAFEAHRVLDVFLHHAGQETKERVHPIFRSTLEQAEGDRQLHYTTRRLPRRRTTPERRTESTGRYVGTDMYIAITPPGGGVARDQKPELSVTTMCSNRHMAEFLTGGRGTAELKLRDNTGLEMAAIIPPTPPREAPVAWAHESPREGSIGRLAWQVINLINLNHLGVGESDGKALREALALFGDLSDPVVLRRIRGLQGVTIRDVTRRLPQRTGVGAARGLEARVILEDKAYEGSGAFLIGAVIERFLVEYVGLNHFVQTVIETVERGVIAQWPPRTGSRGAL